MSTHRRENEGGLGQNPVFLETERILRLKPEVTVLGLSYLLNKRIEPLLLQESRTAEEDWQCRAYHAVGSLIGPDVMLMDASDKAYQQAVSRTVNYMHFLGFADNELSAEGITAQYQEVQATLHPERAEGVAEVINLNSRQLEQMGGLERVLSQAVFELNQAEKNPAYRILKKAYDSALTRIQSLESQINQLLGVDPVKEERNMLLALDSFTKHYDKFPTMEQVIQDNKKTDRLLQVLMSDESVADEPADLSKEVANEGNRGITTLILEGSLDGYQRLESLIESGELTEVLGFQIAGIQLMRDSESLSDRPEFSVGKLAEMVINSPRSTQMERRLAEIMSGRLGGNRDLLSGEAVEWIRNLPKSIRSRVPDLVTELEMERLGMSEEQKAEARSVDIEEMMDKSSRAIDKMEKMVQKTRVPREWGRVQRWMKKATVEERTNALENDTWPEGTPQIVIDLCRRTTATERMLDSIFGYRPVEEILARPENYARKLNEERKERMQRRIEQALSPLTEQERLVLKSSLGLGSLNEKELAEKMGCSLLEIRDIEAQALAKLRYPISES